MKCVSSADLGTSPGSRWWRDPGQYSLDPLSSGPSSVQSRVAYRSLQGLQELTVILGDLSSYTSAEKYSRRQNMRNVKTLQQSLFQKQGVQNVPGQDSGSKEEQKPVCRQHTETWLSGRQAEGEGGLERLMLGLKRRF